MKQKIKSKIKEHKYEIEESTKFIESLQKQLKGKDPNFNKIQQLAILKDKILFHKGAVAVLNDLLEEEN